MNFIEHIKDLRKHLIKTLIYLVIFTCLAFFYMEEIVYFFKKPFYTYQNDYFIASHYAPKLIATGMFEVMTINFKLCLYVAFLLTLPFAFRELWKFVSPGLYYQERKILAPFLTASLSLFYIGMIVGYELLVPMLFKNMLVWTSQYAEPMITFDSYFGSLFLLLFVFGGIFEIPVVLVLLGLSGVLPSSVLTKHRRVIFLGCFIVGAIIAPPDVMSLCFVAIPMYLMVEVSIAVLKKLEKIRQNETLK